MGIMQWLRKALSMEPQKPAEPPKKSIFVESFEEMQESRNRASKPLIDNEPLRDYVPVDMFNTPKALETKTAEEWEAIRQQRNEARLVRMFKTARPWLEGITEFRERDSTTLPGFLMNNGDIHFDMGSDNRISVIVEKGQTWNDVRAILATATNAGAAWPWDEMPVNMLSSVFIMKAEEVAKERAKSEIQPEPRELILEDTRIIGDIEVVAQVEDNVRTEKPMDDPAGLNFDLDYNKIAMLPEPNPHAGECQIEAYREATKDDASIQDRVRDWRRDNPHVQTVTVDQALDIIDRSYAEEEAYSHNEERNAFIDHLKRNYPHAERRGNAGKYIIRGQMLNADTTRPAFLLDENSDFRFSVWLTEGQTWEDIDNILETAVDLGQKYFWRDIPEFPNYEIMANGTIRNKKTRHRLKWNGYKDGQVNLYRSGHKHHRTVAHILTKVWEDNYQAGTQPDMVNLPDYTIDGQILRKPDNPVQILRNDDKE